ncbi:hypothetical protein WJX84_006738 [Apatococcus fuscideae]|uniref:Uncharacterized protein n=1 Tax=Apatococcus fuscideae TaxID=2026836 RepID=A0AAW1T7Z7_9CHLO
MAEIASDMAFRYSENLDPWELEAWSLMLFPEDDADKASCQQLSKAASERLPSEAQDQDAAPLGVLWNLDDSHISSGDEAATAFETGSMALSAACPASDINDSVPESHLEVISSPYAAACSGKTISSGIPAPVSSFPAEDISKMPALHDAADGNGPARLARYGTRAAARVRPRKRQNCLGVDTAADAGAAAPKAAADLPIRRKRHLSSLRENEPGWHAVVPCQRRIPFIYLALEAGELDVPVTLPGPKHRSRKTLRDLAAIPLDQQGPVFAEMHQHVAAAMRSKKKDGDACHQAVLKLTGAVALLGCVFFSPKGAFHFVGNSLLDGRSMQLPEAFQDSAEMMSLLRLDRHQAETARQVWAEATIQLNRLAAERAELLSQIRMGDAQPLAWQEPVLCGAPNTAKLLGQAAQLTQNAYQQRAVLRHASRLCIWQICSPDTLARVIHHAWPGFVDVLGLLQAIAASASGFATASGSAQGPALCMAH